MGWMNKQVAGHPTISLQARIDPSDYAHFGYQFTKQLRITTIKAVTDSGCQSTIIGLELMYAMGFSEFDLRNPYEICMNYRNPYTRYQQKPYSHCWGPLAQTIRAST